MVVPVVVPPTVVFPVPSSSFDSNKTPPYAVVPNTSTKTGASGYDLKLYFQKAGPEAINPELDYLEVNLFTLQVTENNSKSFKIHRATLVDNYFNYAINAGSKIYTQPLLIDDLPLGESGANYTVHVIEHFNTPGGVENDTHDTTSFIKSGAPDKTVITLTKIEDTAVNVDFERANNGALSPLTKDASGNYPAGKTVVATGVKRNNVQFTAKLENVSNGGSEFKRIIFYHTYTPVEGNAAKISISKFDVLEGDIRNGFISCLLQFPAAKQDTSQTTVAALENSEGRNGVKSNTIFTTNDIRVKISSAAIKSASSSDNTGVKITLAPNFYTGSDDKINISVLARKSNTASSNPEYATTNIRNVTYDPSNPSLTTSIPFLVTSIHTAIPSTTASLLPLAVNTSYDFVLVATAEDDGIDDSGCVLLGKKGEISQSETSAIVKGQQLVPMLNQPVFSTNFEVVKIKSPATKNLGGILITNLTYTAPVIVDSSRTLPNHQYWELTKVLPGNKSVIAFDITQFSSGTTTPAATLEALKSFTVLPGQVDVNASYQLSSTELFALPTTMTNAFPELLTNPGIVKFGNNNYIKLGVERVFSFKDLIDSNTVDRINNLAVSVSKGADGHDFLAVSLSHKPLTDESLEITSINLEVSSSSSFSNLLWVASSPIGTANGVKKELTFQQTSDPQEHLQVWIYSANDSVLPQPFVENVAYYVRAAYSVNQKRFTGNVKGSNFIVANTPIVENAEKAPLPGPSSVSAFSNVSTKTISGFYAIPTSNVYPANSSVVGATVELYGSELIDAKPLQTKNLGFVNNTAALQLNFSFILENVQTDSYNILVRLKVRTGNVERDTTATFATVAFPKPVKIFQYEILTLTPPKTYSKVGEIAGKTGLTLRVTLVPGTNASNVFSVLPHTVNGAVASVLNLTDRGNGVWDTTFNALQEVLLIEPVIFAVGVGGSGFDIKY
jgi:hypothetical protein